jgi:excisionase family DNA binding protein
MSRVIPLGPGSRMLTTREAAQRLGVSLRTVQLWVEADILPAARTPGGHRRIPYNAVEALALSTGLGVEPEAWGIPSETTPAAAPGGPMDVLVVADDADWQTQCQHAVEPFGAAVTLRFAETGYLALLQIGQKAPDLLITHLDLPGMDGLAMLHTLERCENLSGLRVLALTPLTEQDLARRGGLPGLVELMPWPVSAEAVAVRVGRLLLGQRVS